MNCPACDQQNETSSIFCPRCKAAIAEQEAAYTRSLVLLSVEGWEPGEPQLQQPGLANAVAESRARASREPHWQERLVTGS